MHFEDGLRHSRHMYSPLPDSNCQEDKHSLWNQTEQDSNSSSSMHLSNIENYFTISLCLEKGYYKGSPIFKIKTKCREGNGLMCLFCTCKSRMSEDHPSSLIKCNKMTNRNHTHMPHFLMNRASFSWGWYKETLVVWWAPPRGCTWEESVVQRDEIITSVYK